MNERETSLNYSYTYKRMIVKFLHTISFFIPEIQNSSHQDLDSIELI